MNAGSYRRDFRTYDRRLWNEESPLRAQPGEASALNTAGDWVHPR